MQKKPSRCDWSIYASVMWTWLGPGLLGCSSDEDSTCGLASSDISAYLTAVDNGDTLRVELSFARGSRDDHVRWLSLCDEESLTILGRDPEVVARQDSWTYSVTVPVAGAPREADAMWGRSADGSMRLLVVLAQGFEVTGPQSGAEVSRSNESILQWEPDRPGEKITIALMEEIGHGICLETPLQGHEYKAPEGVVVDDLGEWSVPADALRGAARAKCAAAYEFRRITYGDYPAVLHAGGEILGTVSRTRSFTSVP